MPNWDIHKPLSLLYIAPFPGLFAAPAKSGDDTMNPEDLLHCQVCQARKEIFNLLTAMSRLRGDAALATLEALGPRDPVLYMLNHIDRAINACFGPLIHGARDCEGNEKMFMPLGDNGHYDTTNLERFTHDD